MSLSPLLSLENRWEQRTQRLQRGTHHSGEFYTGDPGPISEPRRPQRRNNSDRVWNRVASFSGPNYLIQRFGLGNNDWTWMWTRRAVLWAPTCGPLWRSGLAGASFLQWRPGLGWTTRVQWTERQQPRTQSSLVNWFNALALSLPDVWEQNLSLWTE